jgi:hypothetical protein
MVGLASNNAILFIVQGLTDEFICFDAINIKEYVGFYCDCERMIKNKN